MGAAAVDSSTGVPQKTRNGSASDAVTPLPGLYLQNTNTPTRDDPCTLSFEAALFTAARRCAPPRSPLTHEWVRMMCTRALCYLATWLLSCGEPTEAEPTNNAETHTENKLWAADGRGGGLDGEGGRMKDEPPVVETWKRSQALRSSRDAVGGAAAAYGPGGCSAPRVTVS